MPKLRLLLVEDDNALRAVIAEFLRNQGCEVVVATGAVNSKPGLRLGIPRSTLCAKIKQYNLPLHKN